MSESGHMFTCKLCGKLISKAWFGFFDTRLKCGPCCNPPRADEGFFVEVNRDPGDEQPHATEGER